MSTAKVRQSATAGKVPTAAQLALGELAVNTTDGKLFLKKSTDGVESVVEVGSVPVEVLVGPALELNDKALSGMKTATFKSQLAGAATSGAITLNWSSAQNQRQPQPTGPITYTFVNPPGPCHMQLFIDSDGTSAPKTVTWPDSLTWFGAVWQGAAGKKSIINFWFDGTSYSAMGVNQA